MALSYSPKVGEIIECDFGEVVNPPLRPKYNGLIPNEIRKKRMVVVLNGKLPNGCCLVVPISSTGDPDSLRRGFHVPIDMDLIPVTGFYDRRERWAVADCVTHVSKQRLFQIKDGGAVITNYLPRDLVTKIQKAVIKTINATGLLCEHPEPEQEAPEVAAAVDQN
jgi:uncharacterized protein YifN (PemK superfamily)